MLLEDILFVAAVGVVLSLVGLPIVRLLRVARWRRKDPLAEAQERLRIAKLEAEVARVNRETERIYERLYGETLEDDRGGGGGPATTGATDEEAVQAPDERTEKGKRHGQG